MPKAKQEGKSVKVDPETYKRLRQMAAKDRRSITGQIAYLADFYHAASQNGAAKS